MTTLNQKIIRPRPSRVSEMREAFKPTTEVDAHYREFLKNKSVAVVGPARTLMGKKQGSFIDSHDVVVRFNEVFDEMPFPPDLAKDYGTKIDVLYCNQVILRNNVLGNDHRRFALLCDEIGINYIICTNNNLSYSHTGDPTSVCPPSDRNVPRNVANLLANRTTRFRTVYGASQYLHSMLEGHFARTGLIAIMDLLCFDVRELYITGLTFYHGGGHLLAAGSVELHPLKNRDGTWARDQSGFGHDSYKELDLFCGVIGECGPTLKVDEELENLLWQYHHRGSVSP
jgi:hypothetical protein